MKQTLKKLSAFMMAMAISGALFAQVPQKFNYQGIARDTKGNPMAQQRMTLKLTVLPTSDATEGEYEEIQSVTTNEFGLYNLQIGNGTPVKGEMKTVKWETGNKYIKVAIDPKGGNDFVDAGTTQLLSVPYAIYADKAGMAKTTAGSDRAGTVSTSAAGTGTVNYLTKFTAANTIYNSQLFDNGTNVGIGTTTPSAKFHINQNLAGVQEHMRMQNLSTTGAGRFTLYSDGASNYSTFTKYGSAYAGSYAGLTGLYPFGNLLAFGNNGLAAGDGLGRFLISTAGNAGISIFKGGTSKLKFHADFTSENVGIGGNAAPVSRVHLNNTDGTGMDLRLTNTTTGHVATDGMVIGMNGNDASITNRENANLTLGTNNTTRMTVTAAGNVEVANQIKIAGGAPGAGKVLTSDATGLATWQTPASGGVTGSGTLNFVPKFTPNGTTLGNSIMKSDSTQVLIGSNATTWGSSMTLGLGSSGFADTVGISFDNGNDYFSIGENTDGKLIFVPNNTSVNGGSILTLDDNSYNVGIGTDNPSNKLQVVGGITTGDNTTTNGSLTFLPNNGAAFHHIHNNSDGTLQFSHGPTLGSQNIMTLTHLDNGKLGLGTTSPAAKLDTRGSGSMMSLSGFTGNTGVSSIVRNNLGGENWGIYAATDSSTLNNISIFGDVVSTTGLANIGIFGRVSNAPAIGSGNSYGGYFLDAYQQSNTRALGVIGKSDFTDTMFISGGMKINSGTPGNNKVLTSDATGNARWENPKTLPGTIAQVGMENTMTLTPSATISFLSNSRITVVITSSTQVVQITGTVALGSAAVGGADGLDIYPVYNNTNANTPVTQIGGGTFGLRTVQNTRNTYTVTGTVTGLAPGTYYFGVGGYCTTIPANWNNNEFGYVSVMVINQ